MRFQASSLDEALCALFIALLTCNALAGDFEDGFHAAEKGDYKKALPLLNPYLTHTINIH